MSGETEEKASGWTVDTLRSAVEMQFVNLEHMINNQFAAFTRLLDERKETADEAGRVALSAQQTAMRTALEAAEKAVQTALISAEKAVNKAEIAADKRFESLNEFRQQLADQATTFMPRTETVTLITGVDEKLSAHIKVVDANFVDVRRQLDTIRGSAAGTANQRADLSRIISILVSILAAAVAVYAIVRP